MTNKKSLRKEIIQRRAAMPAAEVTLRGYAMRAHLQKWLSINPVRSVFLYSPFRNEPDLTGLIGANPKVTYALPVVLSSTQMVFYSVDKASTFTANRWGILEPDDKNLKKMCQIDEQTLVVIPAVAADSKGYRLGYGAGLYDRYLQHSKATHMLTVYSEFVIEALPHEPHDIKAHYILSESGVGEC